MLAPMDEDVRRLLRRSLIVHFATRSRSGKPFATPLWFVADGGVFYITTGPASRAGRNVTHHGEVALLFRDELSPATFVRMTGVASVHRGLLPWRVLFRLAVKYYLAPAALFVELRHAAQWRLRSRYYGQSPELGYIAVEPTSAELLVMP
jgi:hypothetical protein